jgi:sugar/nucleoside kinase (ribokinase family)
VEHSIEFENVYVSGARTQRVLSTSTPLTLEDIPEEWQAAPIVLLTPVFHDVAPDVARKLSGSVTVLGLGAQGWLRQLDTDRVIPGEIEDAPAWLHGDVVFLSEEDAVDAESAERWRERIPTVVLTRGRNGYTVWDAMGRHDIAPVPGCERDPTGAGDVFATAYLVRHHETADVLESARFAAAAAAISVEAAGIASVATRGQIEARLSAAGARC